jgi:hypothetical protein
VKLGKKLKKHRGAFARKVFIAHNIIEGDNR